MVNLEKKQKNLLEKFYKHRNMIKGSLYSICGKCSRTKCNCGKKIKRTYRLTYKGKGQKSKIAYVPKSKVKEVKKMIENFERARIIIDELLDVNLEILKSASTSGSEKKK